MGWTRREAGAPARSLRPRRCGCASLFVSSLLVVDAFLGTGPLIDPGSRPVGGCRLNVTSTPVRWTYGWSLARSQSDAVHARAKMWRDALHRCHALLGPVLPV